MNQYSKVRKAENSFEVVSYFFHSHKHKYYRTY